LYEKVEENNFPVREALAFPEKRQQLKPSRRVMDVCSMSLKDMKGELAALGGSCEGCCERAEIEARLCEVRQGCHSRQDRSDDTAAPPPGMEHFMASMTSSFNTMGDSFGVMVSVRVPATLTRAPLLMICFYESFGSRHAIIAPALEAD